MYLLIRNIRFQELKFLLKLSSFVTTLTAFINQESGCMSTLSTRVKSETGRDKWKEKVLKYEEIKSQKLRCESPRRQRADEERCGECCYT